MSEAPTLYDWAGGREAIERMIDRFYDRVERDDLLSPLFPGGVSAAHREHVTTWWCEVFGGPAGYTERLGGYPAMLAHHRDLGITDGYLEWGTRLAMHNSQPGAEVVQQAPCLTGAGASPRPTSPDRSWGWS
ncbi:MAG: hypothetical protein WAK82_27450 [Streptosporangiaceae bacterium]